MTRSNNMTWKKTVFRHLLFAVAAAALGLVCTGCFTATVLNGQFGAKTSRFDVPKYAMSPDRREIIVTSAREIRHHYLLPHSFWNRRTTWEERIPVEPVPDGLMRCFLFVEPDPDAQRYWQNTPIVIESGEPSLCEDKTFYLRVHPDDLVNLSQPFKARLIPQGKEAGPPEKQPEGELRMMFPVAVNGNMYVLLTAVPGEPRTNPFREKAKELSMQKAEEGKDIISDLSLIGDNHNALLTQAADEWDDREADRYLYPFRDGMDEVRMTEYERIFGERFPTWDAILWKAFCLPPALVADTLLLPEYCVAGAVILVILDMPSPLQ